MGTFITNSSTPVLFSDGAKLATPGLIVRNGLTNDNVLKATEANALHDGLQDARVGIRGGGLSVDSFGAVGDGVTDDSTVINNAITTLYGLGGGKLWFTPGKTYGIGSNIHLKSHVHLWGHGWNTQIKALASAGDNVSVGVDMLQADYSGVHGLYINGNNSNRTITVGNTGIRIGGSSHCRVSNVKLYDWGKTAVSTNSIMFWLVAYEADDPTNPVPGTDLHSEYNVVENCVFDDSLKKCNFIIRCQGTFDIDQAAEDFTARCANNTFRNCYSFGGSFVGNQFAGAASKNNTFDGCHVRDWSCNIGFSVDKGSSGCRVVNCTVRNFITPGALTATNAATAFRCQGLADYGKTHNFSSYGNVFVGCTASGWGPAIEGCAGFEAHQDTNTIVSGCTFDMRDEDGSSSDLTGIDLHDGTQSISLVGNQVFGAKYGILLGGSSMGMSLDNYDIRNNHLEVATHGIYLTAQDSTYKLRHFAIQNNTIVGGSSAGIAFDSNVAGTKVEDFVVTGNKISNCSGGIRFTGVRHKLANNHITGATGNALYSLTTTDSTIEGNEIRLGLGGNYLVWDETATVGLQTNRVRHNTPNIGIGPTGGTADVTAEATLSSGTVTVSTTAVQADSRIGFYLKTPIGVTLGHNYKVHAVTAGTSFKISAIDLSGVVVTTDASTLRWWIDD